MKILSLFDGVSCARLALEKAGIPIEAYYASEIDKYAIKVTQANRPDTIQLGSVTEMKNTEGHFYVYPGDIDLLIGGSPCQDLSIAKKNREGLNGSRSSLFYEYVRILKEVKPKYFILENVNSMPKEAKEIITKELFGIEPVMINASLVSAQNRKRLFWVGKRDVINPSRADAEITYVKVDVPQPEDRGILLKDILEENVDEKYNISLQHTKAMINTRKSKQLNIPEENGKCGTITASYYKIPNDGNYIKRIGSIGKGGQGDRIYSPDGKSVNLSANGGGGGAKTGLYAVALTKGRTEEGKRMRKEMQKKTGKDWGSWKPEYTQYVPREDGKSNTLTTGLTKEGFIQENTIIRKLTPIECERLQCMPDNWTNPTGDISNTQRYKMCGNAFNVDVVAHILNQITYDNK